VPALVREAGDLAQAQLAAEEADVLVRELVGDALALEDGDVRPKATPGEVAEVALR